MSNITLSFLQDVSGNPTTYGLTFGDHSSDGHLVFNLDMRNDITYPFSASTLTDVFAVGKYDGSNNIFFVNHHNSNKGDVVDAFCKKLSETIINGNLKHVAPFTLGNHSNAGIPVGGLPYLVDETGFYWPFQPWRSKYTPKFLYSITSDHSEGVNLGTCMARVLCVHLFSSYYIYPIVTKNNDIQTNLNNDITLLLDEDESFANADLDGDGSISFQEFLQWYNNTTFIKQFVNSLSISFSKALGGSVASKDWGGLTNDAYLNNGLAAQYNTTSGVEKSTGVENQCLMTMYDKLINQEGRTNDISGAQNVSGTTKTTIASLPFKSGDTLSVFIRPTFKLAPDPIVSAVYNSKGEYLNIPGLVLNSAFVSPISQRFPGSSSGISQAEINKYGWIGSSDNTNNPRTCSQDLTELTDPTIFDAHIWKINIML
jgi:hypothetical protein